MQCDINHILKQTRKLPDMPIKSYVVFPQKGKKGTLTNILRSIENCEVVVSSNKDVLVLVTDTKSGQQEEKLNKVLANIEEIGHLNLVSGFSESCLQENEKSPQNDE